MARTPEQRGWDERFHEMSQRLADCQCERMMLGAVADAAVPLIRATSIEEMKTAILRVSAALRAAGKLDKET